MKEAISKAGDAATLEAEAKKAGLNIPEDRLPHLLATADWLRNCVAVLRSFVASRNFR